MFEHRKHVKLLLKLALPFARKLKDNPQIIEQLTQRATDLVTNITPLDLPPRVHTDVTDNPVITSRQSRTDNPIMTHLPSAAVPSSSSGAHKHMLEFIMEAAQELYAKGQLRVKPYVGY